MGLLEGAQPKKIVEIAQRFFYTGIKISYLNTAKKRFGWGTVRFSFGFSKGDKFLL